MNAQQQRAKRAMNTSWTVTPFPEDRLKRLSNHKVSGVWRVRNRENGHHYVVTQRRNGSVAWDCDCPDFAMTCRRNGWRCKHIEAVRFWLQGAIKAPIEPGFEDMVSIESQQLHQTYQNQGGSTQMTNQNGSWHNRQFARQDELITFPFIQWVNDGGSLQPRSESGGFACPKDQDVDIPGELAMFHHRDGGMTEVTFTSVLEVAVMKTRFAWVNDGVLSQDYTTGAHGKLQAACYVRGPDSEPVGPLMLTFTGLNTREFSSAHREFLVDVQQATRGRAPSYAFWAQFEADERKMVGSEKQSAITGIKLARKVDPDRDYVGDALLDGIPWEKFDEWAADWDEPGFNGSGTFEDEDQSYAPQSEPDPEPEKGSLAWAKEVPLPFEANSYSKGDPLGSLDESALEWLADRPEKYPDAAEAAQVLIDQLFTPEEDDGDKPPF